jgi:hypothetical protein
MSWVTFALGLIRDVATTEAGQDIIKDLRGNSTGQSRPAPTVEEDLGPWRQAVESRLGVGERNMESLVRMLNAQDESLVRIQKRQRVWNLVLAGGLLLALGAVGWLIVR